MAIDDKSIQTARMKVIGIGNFGCKILSQVMHNGLEGVDFIAIDGDAHDLALSKIPNSILVKENSGASEMDNYPWPVFKISEESCLAIKQAIADADVLLIVTGMGGGTGTSSAPIIAEIAKDSGALTIALVSRPFSFEGEHRVKLAEEGIRSLSTKVDTFIIIRTDSLQGLSGATWNVNRAFQAANDSLVQTMQALCKTIVTPGLLGLSLTDINTVMKDAGLGFISLGKGRGENRAIEAAKAALTNPLIDVRLNEAKKVLFSIIGGSSVTLGECDKAARVIEQGLDPGTDTILGVVHDPEISDGINLVVIGTGFGS